MALFAACSLSACANSLLYDETRDKQGQAAKQAAAEAKLAGAVTALENAFTDVAKREEERARDRATYFFDLEIRTVSRAPSLSADDDLGPEGLLATVQDRLTQLGLKEPNEKNLKQLRTLGVQMNARTRALEVGLVEFAGTVGHRFRSCAEIYAAAVDPKQENPNPSEAFLARVSPERRILAREKLGELIRLCRRVDEVVANRNKLISEKGDISSVIQALDKSERDVISYEAERSEARNELNKAIKAFNDSGAEAAKGDRSRLKSVEERAKSLQEVVEKIGKGLAGAHLVTEAKVKHLEIALGAIAGSAEGGNIALSAEEQTAVALVRALPGLHDEADKLLKEARKPRVVPFIAAIDQHNFALQGYEAGFRAKLKYAAALRSQRQALLDEVGVLARVQHILVSNPSWANQPMDALIKNLPERQKREFYRALAAYSDEVQQYRVEAAVWKARAQAAQYEEGLMRARFAAGQWDALIDTIATVLADYHARGIKQSDLAEFFKALGLVAIGIGAAQ